MDVREKLVEIIKNSVGGCARHWAVVIADGLIAHGVTVQDNTQITDELLEQLRNTPVTILQEEPAIETVQECGRWVSYQSEEPYGCRDEKEWYRCSKCEKDAYGRCYEDEWYSAPILSPHCPHCGEKMIPQPPKGE